MREDERGNIGTVGNVGDWSERGSFKTDDEEVRLLAKWFRKSAIEVERTKVGNGEGDEREELRYGRSGVCKLFANFKVKVFSLEMP